MMCMDTRINSVNGEGLGFHQGRLISFSLASIHLDPVVDLTLSLGRTVRWEQRRPKLEDRFHNLFFSFTKNLRSMIIKSCYVTGIYLLLSPCNL